MRRPAGRLCPLFAPLIAALVAMLVTLFATPAAVATVAEPVQSPAVHAYNVPIPNAPGHGTWSERGPPAWAYDYTAHDAVDLWSHGTSARSDGFSAGAIITYATPNTLVRAAGATTTTGSQGVVVAGDLHPLQRWRVAANTARGAADEAAAAGRTNGAAAQFDAGGQRFVDVSGSDTPLHPAVQDALDSVPFPRKPWHGGCAEPRCVSQALEAGVDPSTGTMTAVQIGSRGPVPHGEVRGPCPSCQILRDVFGYDQ